MEVRFMEHHSLRVWVGIIVGSALLIWYIVRMAKRKEAAISFPPPYSAPQPIETEEEEPMSNEEIEARCDVATNAEFLARIKAAQSLADLIALFNTYSPQMFSREEMLRFIIVAEGLSLTSLDYKTLSEVAAKALAEDEVDSNELKEWIDLRVR